MHGGDYTGKRQARQGSGGEAMKGEGGKRKPGRPKKQAPPPAPEVPEGARVVKSPLSNRRNEKRDWSVGHVKEITRALEMRVAGASLEEISRVLHVHKNTVMKWIDGALRETWDEPAVQVRALELARLDALLMGIWQQATAPGSPGQLEAVDRVLKIMGQRTHYILGVDVQEEEKWKNHMSVDQVLKLVNEVAYAVRATLLEEFPAERVRGLLASMQARTQILEATLVDARKKG